MAATRTVIDTTWIVRVSVERVEKVVTKDEYDRTSTSSLIPIEEATEELQIKAQQNSIGAAISLAIATLRLRDPGDGAS